MMNKLNRNCSTSISWPRLSIGVTLRNPHAVSAGSIGRDLGDVLKARERVAASGTQVTWSTSTWLPLMTPHMKNSSLAVEARVKARDSERARGHPEREKAEVETPMAKTGNA